MSAPQVVTACKMKICPITLAILPPLKDSSRSASPENLAHVMKATVTNDHAPYFGINDIDFIDEKEDKNVDLTQR